MEAVMAELQHPRRREILRLCWDTAQPAAAIHAALPDVTFGAISQHLRRLATVGLVRMQKRGRQRLYLTQRAALGPLRRWLEASWDDALYRLKLMAELDAARRGPSPSRSRSAKPKRRPRP
ncbi:MAG: helix-turn-helix domain-containing protein [Planctomycetes bacterium]|nr:helix-turn-helix domain-containing protein [Planctomycetota bacterium]